MDSPASGSSSNPIVNNPMPISSPVMVQEKTAPYMATESMIHCPVGNPFLGQSLKTRFTSVDSAIAMPRSLGMSLGLDQLPRLQSFGWNPGIRLEPKFIQQTSICDIISLEEMRKYARVYFNEFHPHFGLLDREMFESRTIELWASRKAGTDFEACVCGVICLGSFFCTALMGSSPVEAQVLEHGRTLLDLSISHPPGLLSMKHVVGWVLRAIYLRSTTRPHLSWMASCNALHIAEAIGLHREFDENQVGRDVPRHVGALEIDLRRRTFWVALALNQFWAWEYGRTRVHLDLVGCQLPIPKDEDFTPQMLSILLTVPKEHTLIPNVPELLESLKKLDAVTPKSPFLSLLRADASFCIYRTIRSTNTNLPSTHIAFLLGIIRTALEGIKYLTTLKHPWWNIIFTPFHSICVLLSLSTSESLSIIPTALQTLKNMATVFDSHLSNEALRTALALVQGSRDKKKKELESLDQSLEIMGEPIDTPNWSVGAGSSEHAFEWPLDDDLMFGYALDFGGQALGEWTA
jgi:hypothetical protein